jgi:hypothetical protein
MISAGKNGPLQETAKDHKREAARLRALAKSATTSPMKARLLEQARQHDALARHRRRRTERVCCPSSSLADQRFWNSRVDGRA